MLRPTSFSRLFAPLGNEFWIARWAIVGLLFSRGPTAIPRLIIAVVVAPINAFPKWPLSHVFQKSLEAFSPAVADRDALAAPIFEPIVLGIVASLDHVLPRIVGARFLSVERVPVCLRRSSPVMAAIRDASAFQIVEAGDCFVFAVAKADPARSAMFIDVGKSQDDQKPKSLAGNVLEGGHDGLF